MSVIPHSDSPVTQRYAAHDSVDDDNGRTMIQPKKYVLQANQIGERHTLADVKNIQPKSINGLVEGHERASSPGVEMKRMLDEYPGEKIDRLIRGSQEQEDVASVQSIQKIGEFDELILSHLIRTQTPYIMG